MQSELEFLRHLDSEYCHGRDWLDAYENARQLVKKRIAALVAAQPEVKVPVSGVCPECNGFGTIVYPRSGDGMGDTSGKCPSCGGTGKVGG